MSADGLFVAVVGPSGAGKDSVIDGARKELAQDPRYVFVRRVVTRPAGSIGEDHIPVSPEGFAGLRDHGGLALWWQAHDTLYGIPAHVAEDLACGRVVVANLSRAAVAQARARFGAVLVVEVTASPAILARRLRARGRDDEAAIAERLSRRVEVAPDHVIANDGPLEQAVAVFLAVLAARC